MVSRQLTTQIWNSELKYKLEKEESPKHIDNEYSERYKGNQTSSSQCSWQIKQDEDREGTKEFSNGEVISNIQAQWNE